MSNGNISHKTKKKRTFNIVDFFIVVAIILAIAILVYAFSPWSQLKKLWALDEVSIDYTVIIRDVDKADTTKIKKDDVVTNSVTKNPLGTVTNIGAITNSTVLDYIEDENGDLQGVLSENPDKYDITVHITAVANYEEGIGYTVNGCRIAVGEELYLRFPQYVHSGFCIAFDPNS